MNLPTGLEYVAKFSNTLGNERTAAEIWTSKPLAVGQYAIRIRAAGWQNSSSRPMLVTASALPILPGKGDGGPGRTKARVIKHSEKVVQLEASFSSAASEHWYKLTTDRQGPARIRVESPDDLDLMIDLYEGSPKPTGKRVLYLHPPHPTHNLDTHFTDVAFDGIELADDYANPTGVLSDARRLKAYDAVVIDAPIKPDNFGLNRPDVIKTLEAYAKAGGRVIILTPICKLEGLGVTFERLGQASNSRSQWLGQRNALISAYPGEMGTLVFPGWDEIGAFSNWTKAGWQRLFRH